jgi:hypothetical protein
LTKNGDPLSVGTAIAVSFGGILLTIIWYRSTVKTWRYVRHWWDSIIEIEKDLNMGQQKYDIASRLESAPKDCLPYRCLVQAIPLLFGMAWAALLILSIARCAYLMR